MPNDIPHLEAYTAEQFRRKTGCSKLHARGYNCDQFSHAVTLRTIMSASVKPAGCSEARWRMELRRRAQQKALGRYYVGYTTRNH